MMEKALLISVIALWIAFLVQSLFLLALFRYIGWLIERFPQPGLPVGEPAPVRQAVDWTGKTHLLGRPSDRKRMLLFVSPSCPWCEKLLPHLTGFAASHHRELEVLVISTSKMSADQQTAYARRLRCDSNVRLVASPKLAEAYKVHFTPFAIVLDEAGTVRATGVPNGLKKLKSFLVFDNYQPNIAAQEFAEPMAAGAEAPSEERSNV